MTEFFIPRRLLRYGTDGRQAVTYFYLFMAFGKFVFQHFNTLRRRVIVQQKRVKLNAGDFFLPILHTRYISLFLLHEYSSSILSLSLFSNTVYISLSLSSYQTNRLVFLFLTLTRSSRVFPLVLTYPRTNAILILSLSLTPAHNLSSISHCYLLPT